MDGALVSEFVGQADRRMGWFHTTPLANDGGALRTRREAQEYPSWALVLALAGQSGQEAKLPYVVFVAWLRIAAPSRSKVEPLLVEAVQEPA